MAKNKSNLVGAGALGAALGAAAAAGAYFFYGSDHASKHRRTMKSWMVKAKGEVMEKLETLGDVSEKGYHEAVAQVMDKYKKLKHIDAAELGALAADMKKSWHSIAGHLQTAKPSKPVKRVKGKVKAK